MSQKYNQAKRKFAYKNDTRELTELAQFLRDAFHNKISVKREWFIIFNDEGQYMRTQNIIPRGNTRKYRTPDLTIFKNDKNQNEVTCERPLLCLEVDGSIHNVCVEDTLKRNKDYKTAGIDLVVVDKSDMKISIFDMAYSKCETLIKQKLEI